MVTSHSCSVRGSHDPSLPDYFNYLQSTSFYQTSYWPHLLTPGLSAPALNIFLVTVCETVTQWIKASVWNSLSIYHLIYIHFSLGPSNKADFLLKVSKVPYQKWNAVLQGKEKRKEDGKISIFFLSTALADDKGFGDETWTCTDHETKQPALSHKENGRFAKKKKRKVEEITPISFSRPACFFFTLWIRLQSIAGLKATPGAWVGSF